MTSLRRLAVDDELLLDDELVVLVGQRVILLSPLASYALGRLGPAWTDTESLRDQLVEVYGDPGTPDAVADLVAALVDEGLVEVQP